MSNVEFDESGGEYRSAGNFAREEISGITRLLIKLGIAKNESQAKIVMVIIVVFCLSATAFVLFSGKPKTTSVTMPDFISNAPTTQQ